MFIWICIFIIFIAALLITLKLTDDFGMAVLSGVVFGFTVGTVIGIMISLAADKDTVKRSVKYELMKMKDIEGNDQYFGNGDGLNEGLYKVLIVKNDFETIRYIDKSETNFKISGAKYLLIKYWIEYPKTTRNMIFKCGFEPKYEKYIIVLPKESK